MVEARTGQGAGGSDRDSSALDGSVLRTRLHVLPGRPVPRLPATGRRLGRRDHVLRRLDPVHGRRGAPELAGVGGMAVGRGRRARGVVVGHRPVRRDALLQRHDLSGDARRADELRLRQARLATRLARIDLLPRLRRDRLRGVAAPRTASDGLPARGGEGWWQPAVNLLGCIFFGISAVAGYVVPSTGSIIDLAAANWNTSLGAACFLACALDTLHTGRASKMPLRRELRELEHVLERDLERLT